jgi:transcriptional regulator with XRE-family HTH domain
MERIYAQTQMETLHARLRIIREARHLTLKEAARLSKGQISAMALGSYERGDRSISAAKLIVIADIYQLPLSELFESPTNLMNEERICIDLRAILRSSNPSAHTITEIIRNIARMRGDWNGEVISLRAQDIKNFQIFSGLSADEIKQVIEEYGFPRLK